MARWRVYAEYGFESMEAEVADDDLTTEDHVVRDFLENVQVWAELLEDE
jgi:hypothetical protein